MYWVVKGYWGFWGVVMLVLKDVLHTVDLIQFLVDAFIIYLLLATRAPRAVIASRLYLRCSHLKVVSVEEDAHRSVISVECEKCRLTREGCPERCPERSVAVSSGVLPLSGAVLGGLLGGILTGDPLVALIGALIGAGIGSVGEAAILESKVERMVNIRRLKGMQVTIRYHPHRSVVTE